MDRPICTEKASATIRVLKAVDILPGTNYHDADADAEYGGHTADADAE